MRQIKNCLCFVFLFIFILILSAPSCRRNPGDGPLSITFYATVISIEEEFDIEAVGTCEGEVELENRPFSTSGEC